MIPQGLLKPNFIITEESEPTKDYKVIDKNIQGYTDEIEALQQAIYFMLNTEKYEYPIYSFHYGLELESLIGQDPVYVKIELKRRIQECLLQDDRVISVDNFIYTINGDEMLCTFDVSSIYGPITVSKEVNI